MITPDNQLIKLFVIISNSVANYEGKGFSYIRKYGTGIIYGIPEVFNSPYKTVWST